MRDRGLETEARRRQRTRRRLARQRGSLGARFYSRVISGLPAEIASMTPSPTRNDEADEDPDGRELPEHAAVPERQERADDEQEVADQKQ